jgi:L-gulono-1,4-lactone dehydrogenase
MEVAAVIREAAGRRLRVRVAGSGHSFTDAVCTPEMLLSLKYTAGVLDVDLAGAASACRSVARCDHSASC